MPWTLASANSCRTPRRSRAALTPAVCAHAALIGTEVKHLGERIQAGRYGLVELSREARITADFPAYAAGAFGKGIDAGYGTEDLAALIKVLRQSV
jgi:hypothetical protein